LIGGEEADAARAEVARRLLQLKKPDAARGVTEPSHLVSTRVMQGVLAAIPLAGMALYLMLGSPSLPGQPLLSRQAAPSADAPFGDLIERVEAELKKNPEDIRGWTVIAPVYLRMKRYDDAANSYAQILRLNGDAVDPLLSFAEAVLLANNGLVNDSVKRAANRVLQLKPDRIEPRVWLAMGKEQEGDVAGAIADYKALVASAPADAPWRVPVQDQLNRLDGGRVATGAPQVPGAPQAPTASNPQPGTVGNSTSAPSAEAIAALPPQEQQKQIAAMVDRLAARLKENGNDLPGWERLLRAYQVMGRKDDATAALAQARKQFASEPKTLESLDGLARSLGL
jgi:cytochrome c-type biogenesis protein CcmH